MDKKILVIDDEPRYVKLIEVNLLAKGYQVIGGSNGQQAVELVAELRPDLVLLDVMTPVMDGFTACQRIREFSSVPIIMITAKGDEADRVQGLDIGADDYIVKPFSAQELLARVRSVLRRSELTSNGHHRPTFVHGDLQINFAEARVTVRGEPVALSATEYRVLRQLAGHAGQVLTPEYLLSTVWGPEYLDDKEILWVCLSRLRQKIETNPRKPEHVVTRAGLGYLMPDASGLGEG